MYKDNGEKLVLALLLDSYLELNSISISTSWPSSSLISYYYNLNLRIKTRVYSLSQTLFSLYLHNQ